MDATLVLLFFELYNDSTIWVKNLKVTKKLPHNDSKKSHDKSSFMSYNHTYNNSERRNINSLE